ncbi:MAG TPA: hypothetical protein PLS51_09545 [Flavobacterium sp.]|jgi:hypothetical protein|nr:hypothetical protein [Flavobacterium sp.]HPJ10862.1 hypothetical protein [Flavobacterium sp.]
MKNNASAGNGFQNPVPIVDGFEERLLNIYWEKKNLEEFLPQIATYSSTQELVAITIAQLSVIEKQLISLLQEISEFQN